MKNKRADKAGGVIHCYSYTKEIKLGQCAIDLGAEEAEALAMAMGE